MTMLFVGTSIEIALVNMQTKTQPCNFAIKSSLFLLVFFETLNQRFKDKTPA